MPRIVLAIFALVLPLAAQDDLPLKANDSTITKPTIIHKVEPKYTKAAERAKIEGSVKLSIIISTKGRAENDIKIDESLDPGLDANAIAAVRQWRFNPATKDGKPVRVYATIVVLFHLSPPKALLNSP